MPFEGLSDRANLGAHVGQIGHKGAILVQKIGMGRLMGGLPVATAPFCLICQRIPVSGSYLIVLGLQPLTVFVLGPQCDSSAFNLGERFLSRSSPHKTYYMETQRRRSWAWPVW